MVDQRAYNWLMARDVEKWTLLYDGGARYGTMTTNASESFNGVLKRARGLPIQELVSTTYYHCIALFLKRGEDALRWENDAVSRFVPKVMTILGNREAATRNLCRPVQINRTEFSCYDDKNIANRVLFGEDQCSCSCHSMVLYHIPCAHMIASLATTRCSHEPLVSDFYTICSYKNTYSGSFHGIPDITW
ncbi:hypothetical protein KSP39_PZI015585 [Platanthera zijinensis]|uniref:SWIM-type domain-containing protein n=1 Tax=Platanthera zijinensis TaxID=2320716 RepID=A0AAP0B7T6_9ASPA